MTKTAAFSTAPIAFKTLDADAVAALDAACPHPRTPLRSRAAIVAIADGLWLDLAAPGQAGHLVADVLRAVPGAGLGEIRVEIVRREQAGALSMLPGETPLDAVEAALGPSALTAIKTYQALVAQALQAAQIAIPSEASVDRRAKDGMLVLRHGRKALPLLLTTKEGRAAAERLQTALGRLRRLHPDGRLSQTSPRLSGPALRAMTGEEIAARLDAAGLSDLLPVR